jgi:hypothetical protein
MTIIRQEHAANARARLPTAPVATVAGTGGRRHPRPRRLGGRTRKAFLVLHIASAGAWIGIDVVMGVLIFTPLLTSDPQLAAICYQALEIFAVWPLIVTGLLCLASGMVLGLGSKYGLVRYWWVAVKLVLNLVLVTLVVFALRPGLPAAAEYGRQLADGRAAGAAPSDLIFPPIVSTLALLVATVLSVYKPWGRIRRVVA